VKEFETGDLINEQYRVIRKIGQGGMNKIFLVEDLHGEGNFAMKITKDPAEIQMNAPEAYNKFLKEITILSTIRHPILPKIKDYFAFEDKYCIIEEFIAGESLEEHINNNLPSAVDVVRWSLVLCNVLETLHSNSIIFRDLKPANIMLTEDGQVKLIDFDISRHYKEGQLVDTMLLGTPGYAAPETYGKTQSDVRSDIYSLGATMHHLLTGIDPQEKPFHFESLDTARPGLTGSLVSLVGSMLSIKPEKRPQSMNEVRNRLNRVLQEMERDPSRMPAPPDAPVCETGEDSQLSFFDLITEVISGFFGALEGMAAGNSEYRKCHIVNDKPALTIADRSSWKPTEGPVDNVFPDTHVCFPQKVTDVFVSFKSIRVTKKATLRVRFSFTAIYGDSSGYKPWNLDMGIIVGMPLDDSYISGRPSFGIIPGTVLSYDIESPNSWRGDSVKTTVQVMSDGSVVKGEFIWQPNDDSKAVQYALSSPWQGPRFVLYVSQAYYSWVYTKGFYIVPSHPGR
jgi:serine/threonine protein kinase